MSQLAALDFVRSGTTSFFRLPHLRPSGAPLDVALGARDDETDAIILGVPFDGGATLHAGARHGPSTVRAQSALLPSFCPRNRLDVFQTLRTLDGGNVCASPFSLSLTHEAIEADVAALTAAGVTPFLVGGDHSVTLPALRALARARGPVALVHFDAHADTSTADTWGTAVHHGTWLRQAIEEGLIEKGALVQIGVRGPDKDEHEHALALAHGARLVTADDVADRGPRHAIAQAWQACEGRPLWLSLDVDALDPAFAPGTGTPVPGGLTTREVRAMVRGLSGLTLVGMDVVEVCPALDEHMRTAHVAAHLLFDGLSVRAASGRASR